MRYFLLTILCALLLLSTQLGEEVHATVKAPTVKVVSVTKTFTRTFSKTSTRTSTSSRTPTATKTATITRTPSRTLTSTVTPSKTFTITRTPSRTPPPTRTVAPEVVPDVIVKGFRSVFVYSGDICFGKKVGSLSNTIGVIQQNIGWIGIYDGACFMSGQGWYEVFLYTRVRGLIYTTEFLPVWVATSTPTATKTSTSTSTPSATLTPSNTPTLTPTSTHTSTPTATNTNTPTVTFSPTSTNTPTHTATNTPTVTNTPTITVIPSINWVIDETGTFELEMSEGSRCYVKNIVGYPTSWVLIEFTGDMLGSPVVAQDVKCTEDESSTIDIYNFLIRNGYTVNEIKALP